MTSFVKIDLNDNISNYKDLEINNVNNINITSGEKCSTFNIELQYNAVYGLGEKFNKVNQKYKEIKTKVYEKFCYQGDNTYCPVPFFFTDNNVGVYVDTYTVVKFEFNDKNINIMIKKNSKGEWPQLYLFQGTPKTIISEFLKVTSKPTLVPKWSLGVWMSANRWNTQEEIENQIEMYEKNKLPANVLVIEAWSDELTFYKWNDKSKWDNPKEMIDKLHSKGIKLILWQIPVIKNDNNDDWNYAVEHELCVHNDDGTPYIIPEGHWFAGCLIPDFTNPETEKWWFSKRKYLLDMGVDGFKTDGGEFIYTENAKFYNGTTGSEMTNGYVSSYIEAYTNFIGKDRILFSRAGYTNQQKYPMQWAGDQQSTWEEFRHILVAGLSCGLSGIPFWGFDIAGFAGPMPSIELYERATQMAVFSPVMQWHSEPVGGQFADLMPTESKINDRSPWNMAKQFNDKTLIQRLQFHYNLRTNLLPYIYDLAIKASETGLPLMKHLILEYPNDPNVFNIEDTFMLGDILISPIIYKGQTKRKVYLPKGNWIYVWNGETFEGNNTYEIDCGKERIPVFIKEGCCIPLNLSDNKKIGGYVGNNLSEYNILCFYITGKQGKYHFRDDLGNDILITWKDGNVSADHIKGNEKYEILYKLN